MNGTLLLFSRCSRRDVAVMMEELPAVREVRRYIVSGSSAEKGTGFVDAGPEFILLVGVVENCILGDGW